MARGSATIAFPQQVGPPEDRSWQLWGYSSRAALGSARELSRSQLEGHGVQQQTKTANYCGGVLKPGRLIHELSTGCPGSASGRSTASAPTRESRVSSTAGARGTTRAFVTAAEASTRVPGVPRGAPKRWRLRGPALEVADRRQRRVADYLVDAAAQVGARHSRSLDRERTCAAVQRAYCSRGPVRKCARRHTTGPSWWRVRRDAG
jgi:hypothetical protein